MEGVKQTRNNAVSGLMLLLGSILLAFGSISSVLRVKSAPVDLGLLKGLSVGLDFSGDGQLDSDTRVFLLICAGLIAVAGFLLLVTRVRFVGLLWRFGALLALAFPALAAYEWWRFVEDPVDVIKGDASQGLGAGVLAIIEGGSHVLGLWHVVAGIGLYAISAGAVIVFLGAFAPAFRGQKLVGPKIGRSASLPESHSRSVANDPEAGWYESGTGDQNTLQWWDGHRWTGDYQRRSWE